jgi:hypothetical protein
MAFTSRWQDWISFALGLWLALSPWLADYVGRDAATANAVFCGVALALAAHFEASCRADAAEWLNLALGAWLIAAPLLLGFAGSWPAGPNSIAVGVAVAALAASALQLDKRFRPGH